MIKCYISYLTVLNLNGGTTVTITAFDSLLHCIAYVDSTATTYMTVSIWPTAENRMDAAAHCSAIVLTADGTDCVLLQLSPYKGHRVWGGFTFKLSQAVLIQAALNRSGKTMLQHYNKSQHE